MIEGAAPTGATRAAQHCEELLSNSLETLDVVEEVLKGTASRSIAHRTAADVTP